jgi:uncharacterized damage-inducible protein DinB
MPEQTRRDLQIHIVPETHAPAVARLRWMIEDTRQLTLETLEDIPAAWLDWTPPVGDSVGTLLYHIAVIEADWLYEEILVQPFPPALADLFQHPIRTATGSLHPVIGEALTDHMARWAAVRAALLDTLAHMDDADLRRVRVLPAYDVTPEWVLHHLIQHEAEHRGQIGAVITWARAQGIAAA